MIQDGQNGREAFDADIASTQLTQLWRVMAEAWQDRALNAECPADAVAWASIAAEALWCATGENSGLSFKDILRLAQTQSGAD